LRKIATIKVRNDANLPITFCIAASRWSIVTVKQQCTS